MGVDTTLLQEGDGTNYPNRGQNVMIHYTGTFPDGNQFDSSRDRGQPFTFRVGLGHVIRGIDEAVIEMSIGQRMRLVISPE